MTNRWLPALISLSILAAGCSKEPSTTAPATPPAASAQQAVATHAAADYEAVVQQIYVAYFGRPADAAGLNRNEGLLAASAAPVALDDMSNAYASNAGLRSVVDSFNTSEESQALYVGDNRAFISSVYANLFNRAPDAAGLAYWSKAIDDGVLTRANAAISIMAGAQGSDKATVAAKTTVARNFTNALDTSAKAAAYSGMAANASVRSMLGTVSGGTDPAAFQGTVSATVAKLAPAPKS